MTEISKLGSGSISDMQRATNHAGVTVCNRGNYADSDLAKRTSFPKALSSPMASISLECSAVHAVDAAWNLRLSTQTFAANRFESLLCSHWHRDSGCAVRTGRVAGTARPH